MPRPADRDPSDSLCLQPTSAPRAFHHFSASEEARTVRNEIVDELWDRAPTSVAAAALVGDVLGRMKAAASGRLAENVDEFEPVRRQPELWELKWKFKRVGEFRLYHAEPGENPELVALRFHQKETEGLTPEDIQARQNDQMDLAADRYTSGETRRWGHRRGCTDCLTD
jgi:hypothetical protein